MSEARKDPQEDDRLEVAARWRIRISADRELSRSDEFLGWLSDPVNQEAFARSAAAWNAFDEYAASPQILGVRRDALERARRASRRRFVPKRAVFLPIAASLMLVLIGAVVLKDYFTEPSAYQTAVGERRVERLEDGSRISLDSDTLVKVRYSRDARQLVLVRGRARFDVVHDIMRPFTVTAGNETVVAVGTSFDVEQLDGKVLVTLIEGRVVVKTNTPAPEPAATSRSSPVSRSLAMSAGQELVAVKDSPPFIAPANLPVATAWESGQLVFNNEPLGQAVERVNRYTDKPLLVDAAVASLRISGVFNAGDVGAFVDAVTSYFPVQASTNDANQTILQRRS
jgi:transmembrane sensor